jgi:hypothetical protein
MGEPFSLAAIGAVALTEGIKFLYGQTGDLIKRWQERRTRKVAGNAESDRTQVDLTTPPAMGATTIRADADFDAVEAHAEELLRLRSGFANVADGLAEIDPNDADALARVGKMRDLLEEILGVSLTFTGEQRPATGEPVVRTDLTIGNVFGKATGADIDEMRSGTVETRAAVGDVAAGGEVTGTRIGQLGGRPDR